MSDRAVVFIDAQNMYRGARRAFFAPTDAHMFGQFHPRALGERVASHGRPGDARQLVEVRIYSGRPNPTRSPKTYAAHMRQCAAWETSGVR